MKRKTLLSLLLLPSIGFSDVVRDGSIGPDASVQASGPSYVIDESMGEISGTNLFHSFSQFNLNSSQSANFNGSTGINNVITRITGDGASQLDGSLSSSIAGAGLYFINPNGVVFGENAKVSVDGNFHVSTADFLRFEDGTQFSVSIGDSQSILSSAAPQAFGFLGNDAPATIIFNSSQLSFKEQSRQSIVAGDIELNSSGNAVIQLPGGELKIVSVASGGEVSLAMDASLDASQSLGVIAMRGPVGVAIEVDDDAIDDAPDPLLSLSGEQGGHLFVQARQLDVENFSIATHTTGALAGLPTGIELDVSGAINLSGNSQLSSTSEGAGEAGDVIIKVGTLRMQDDAEILSDTFDSARGGAVNIQADTIEMIGDAELGSDVEGSGDGGEVNITVGSLTIGGEAEISTDTSGTGKGGSVTITASREINLLQQGGIFSDTNTSARAGDITINTPRLVIRGEEEDDDDDEEEDDDDEEGELDDDLFEAAGIYSVSTSTGSAGDISITANTVEVFEEAAIAASAVNASGGNITINASEKLNIRGSAILADVNDGIGGNITINSPFVTLHDSLVVARAGDGQGGAIVIDANQYFSSESLVSASAGPAGISGTVTTPSKIDLSGTLSSPETQFRDQSSLLTSECRVRGNVQRQGSLVAKPRKAHASSVEGLLFVKDRDSNSQFLLAPELFSSTKPQQNMGPEMALWLSQQARKKKSFGLLSEASSALQTIESSQNAYVLLHIGNSVLKLDENNLSKAYQYFKQAEKIARSFNDQRALSFSLGNLALLYFKENRFDEAIFLTHQALGAARAATTIEAEYRWHWLEGKLLWSQGQTGPAIAALERATNILSRHRLEAGVDEMVQAEFFKQDILPVYFDLLEMQLAASDLVKDDRQRQAILLSARSNLEKIKAAELRDYYSDPCITEVESKTRAIDQIDSSTAVVYPVALENRLELLVALNDGIKRYSVDVSRDSLMAESDRFLGSLQKVNSLLYRRHAKKLYRWLIEPMREELQSRDIRTLVFVPSPEIRILPFAALYDGQEFLIQQYALATVPGLNLVDPKPISKEPDHLLLAGLSQESHGFAALPNVERELTFIEKLAGETNSHILLNEQFDSNNLRSSLKNTHPDIVHIASHARFSGKQKDNFVLSYDGRVDMDKLREYIGVAKYRSGSLDLLILSACETAAGDQRAALGLAGMAIQAGARSALGSLWRIDDEAAFQVISGFYRELFSQQGSKADALRESQLKLLQDREFSHPYFWSPYIIVSNWL